MQEIPLSSEPNQSFTLRLDGTRYGLTLKEANGCMVADVEIDGVVVLTGQRIVAGTPIIPYRYIQVGNFVLLTTDDALPDYREFGSTQSLIYASPVELAAL